MAETTEVTVTKTWAKLSDGDCTVQSVISSELFDIAISTALPTTNARIQMRLNTPVTFAYKTAVWIRLNQLAQTPATAKVNVIK